MIPSTNANPTNPAAPTPTIAPTPAHPGEHEHHGPLFRAVRAVFSVTLLSRFGGLARDMIVGRVFGDTVLNSAFQAAFAIPNMFRRLFGEGALSAAFIPAYTDAVKAGDDPRHRDHADQLASLTLTVLAIVTGALTVVIELALCALLLWLPYDAERVLSFHLVMVMLPFMPLICLAAIQAGMLQVHSKFAASASGPLLLNAFIIAIGVYAILTGQIAQEGTAYLFAIATVLSGLTQTIWFARLLRRHFTFTRVFTAARTDGVVMLRRFIPVMVGLGTLQLNAFLDTLIAMWPIWVGPTLLGRVYPLDAKSNGILSMSARLYQFPLGVFGIAVATAVFPLLARHAKDHDAFSHTLRRGVRLSLLLGIPASVGLILVRQDLTAVLFSGGKTGFSPEGLVRSAAVLMGFAPGVWAYSLNHVLTRAFYAKGDTVTPMRVAVAMVFLNFTLNMLLIWPLREAGLAWATSTAAAIQCVVLGFILVRREGGMWLDGVVLRSTLRIVLATFLMSGACLLTLHFWPESTRWTLRLLRLTGICVVGIVGFAAAAWALGVQEVSWLLHKRHYA